MVDIVPWMLEDEPARVYAVSRSGVLDAAECPSTFSTPPGVVCALIAGGPDALTHAMEDVEDQPESGARDLATLDVGADEVVVGIAASGRTPYVLGAIAAARSPPESHVHTPRRLATRSKSSSHPLSAPR
jgi:N-acetylmuramic acid 6-phosphate (MurNAc-6-P) etherase